MCTKRGSEGKELEQGVLADQKYCIVPLDSPTAPVSFLPQMLGVLVANGSQVLLPQSTALG